VLVAARILAFHHQAVLVPLRIELLAASVFGLFHLAAVGKRGQLAIRIVAEVDLWILLRDGQFLRRLREQLHLLALLVAFASDSSAPITAATAWPAAAHASSGGPARSE